MGVNEAGIDVILDLVDQLHGLRMAMRDLISAVGSEAPAVKRRLRAALDKDFDARSF
ncbi:hypothetical protein [Rhizobium leguminosarum]